MTFQELEQQLKKSFPHLTICNNEKNHHTLTFTRIHLIDGTLVSISEVNSLKYKNIAAPHATIQIKIGESSFYLELESEETYNILCFLITSRLQFI